MVFVVNTSKLLCNFRFSTSEPFVIRSTEKAADACKRLRSVEWEPPHNVAPYRPENDRILSYPSSSGHSGSHGVPSLKMGMSQPARPTAPLTPKSPNDENPKSSLGSSSKSDASAVFDMGTEDSRTYASSYARLKPQTTLAFWEITK